MKIIILNGSPKAHGNTATALHEVERTLQQQSIARRGGATTTIDVLNKYFLKTNMPVVPSQYWSIAHGTAPGEVVRDEEGMQTMRQLGLNMAFMIKSFRLGLQQYGSPKIQEKLTETHFIR
jgi:multimeric flavodoxin WrbA